MKALTNEQRVVRFTKEDPMNAMFVRIAIENFCKEAMLLDATKETNALFSTRLIQDIAKDWMQSN